MTAIMKNDANGLECGLVVLRDVVSYGGSPYRGQSLSATLIRPTSESCTMRVVSKNLNDLLED